MKRVRDRKQSFGRKGAYKSRCKPRITKAGAEGSAAHKTTQQKKNILFEVEVLDGLGPICRDELADLLSREGRLLQSSSPSAVTLEYTGKRENLLKLRTAVAVFELLYFKVPHPFTIVQGAHLSRVIAAITDISASARFTSFRIGAAGSDSPVFQKIKKIIEARSRLVNDEKDGQMSIRFRRSRLKPFGWDVLIRLTPLPLSARAWRVENMPGALNATIAAAMILQMNPKPSDRFLNAMCGSGTLIAERCAICPAQEVIGVDTSRAALEKARRNLSRFKGTILLEEDAGKLSLKNSSVDAICADLPWGRLIGKKQELKDCYSAFLREMARVCSVGGRLAVITQENELFEKALDEYKQFWFLTRSFRVKQSEYKPKLYVLKRTLKIYQPNEG